MEGDLGLEVHLEINRRILIVDDNESIHQDFRKLLCPKPRSTSGLVREMAAMESALFEQDGPAAPREPVRYELDSAYQAMEGYELICQAEADGQPYALVFVDVRMPPGMDGVQLIEMVWRKYPDLEIVICTAYSDYTWEDLNRKFGERERLLFVRKPFDHIAIRQIAAALTKKRNAEQALRKSRDELQALNNIQKADLLEAKRGLEGKQRVLQETNRHLRNLLSQNKIAIWNEDYSAAKRALVALGAKDARDLGEKLRKDSFREARRIAKLIKIEQVDRATQDLFGAEEMGINHRARILNGELSPVLVDELCAVWQGEPSFYAETTGRDEQGQEVHAALSISLPERDEDLRQAPVGMMDITARKRAEQLLRQEAGADALTGLPNRRLFLERLSAALRQSERAERPSRLAVLFIDLDKFKPVNDNLGHPVGDEVLRQVAKRLERCVRGSDMVARYGGDEFTVILHRQRDAYDPKIPADKICSELARPFHIGGLQIEIGGSVGISTFPGDGRSAMDLVACADAAMYRAKQDGGGCRFYRGEMNRALGERGKSDELLRAALERDRLELAWQSVVDLDSGAIVGAEALLRWPHPELGVLPARDVLAQARNVGLLTAVDRWAFHRACREAGAFWKRAPGSFRAHLNLTGALCGEAGFPETARQALADSGAPDRALAVDLAESAFFERAQRLEHGALALEAAGFSLSIDDFGETHGSALALARLPLAVVKLAPAMTRDDTLADVVESLVGLAHRRGRQVVAEGVETEEQAARARRWGVDAAQGHYFAKPQPLAGLVDQL